MSLNNLKAIKNICCIGAGYVGGPTMTVTLNCQKEDFLIKGTLWEGKRLYELYKEAYTPWEWHQELIEEANYNFHRYR